MSSHLFVTVDSDEGSKDQAANRFLKINVFYASKEEKERKLLTHIAVEHDPANEKPKLFIESTEEFNVLTIREPPEIMQRRFAEKRHIVFPSNLFIELTLSPNDVSKMRRWQKEGHDVIPMWYASCERVLFIDQTRFEKWKKKKKARH